MLLLSQKQFLWCKGIMVVEWHGKFPQPLESTKMLIIPKLDIHDPFRICCGGQS